jgi:hypothetical protein
MSFWTPLWMEMKHGVFITLLNQSNSHCNGAIRIPQTFEFGGTLDRRWHFKHVSNKAGSTTVKRARLTGKGSISTQCCQNKQRKFPYRPTCDIILLSWHAFYIPQAWTFNSAIFRQLLYLCLSCGSQNKLLSITQMALTFSSSELRSIAICKLLLFLLNSLQLTVCN